MSSVSLSLFSPKIGYKKEQFQLKGAMMGNITTTSVTTAAGVKSSSLGFKNLMESFTVDIHRAEGRQLNVPLISPFTIANSRLDGVENVAIRVELSNGCCGWGESPVLPFVTAEDQKTALIKANEACDFLKNSQATSLGHLLKDVGQLLPGHHFASVRNLFIFIICCLLHASSGDN